MQKRGLFLAFVAAAVLCVSCLAPAPAAGPVEPLPEHVAGLVSFKSPIHFLEALDEYVAATTEGTANALPPSLLTMLAAVYLPVPMDSWNADEEAHLVIMPSGPPSSTPVVLLIRVDDFAEFLQSLEDKDWLVGDESEEEDRFVALYPAVLPGGKAVVLANLGGGRAAVADTAARIHQALADGDWYPSYHGDADVSAVLATNITGGTLVDNTAAYIARRQDEIAAAIARNGIKPEVARGIAALMEKYAPKLVGELEMAESLHVEMRIDEDELVLDMGGLFVEGALLREIADNAAKAPALDQSLARRFPATAASVALGASVDDLVTDVRQRYIDMVGDIYGTVWPSFKNTMVAFADAYFHNGPGQTAVASFMNGERQSSVSIIKAHDPEAMQKQFVDGMQELNNLWAASIDTPDLEARFVGETKNNGSQVYYAFQPRFGKDGGEKFQQFLDDIAEDNPELRSALKINPDFRIYISRLDDALVFGAGDLREEEFTALLGNLNRDAAEPLFGLSAAANLLDDLAPAQVSVALMNADELFRMAAIAMAREADVKLPDGMENPFRLALETARLQDRGDLFGFSLGGRDGALTLRMIMPVEAVNAVVRDYEAFEKVRVRETRRLLNEQQQRESENAPVPPSEEDDGVEEEEDVDFDEVDAA